MTPLTASVESVPRVDGGRAGARLAIGRCLAAAAWVAGFAVLFALNLRLSQTMASNSDSAGPMLQGWDMLHGNILQHGWITADVPYYPTEVTEDALVALVRGLNSDAVHWGGALTYTLAMLFVALLAMGRRGRAGEAGAPSRRQRIAMGAIAAGIMLAPQLSAGTYTLLLGPDHFGTAIPVLVSWLILDRVRPRWYVPVLLALILGWTSVADLTAVFIGAVPLAGVYAYRIARARLGPERLPLAFQRYEIALAAAGLVAALMGAEGQHILTAIGSLYHEAPQTQFSPLHLIFWHNFQVAGLCLLILAGADFVGVHHPAQLGLALLHLVGAVLAASAILLAAWRFVRDKDVVSQLLIAGIFLNLLTFVVGTHSLEITFAREITPVLSFGAVLAGRLLARRLLAMRLTTVLIVALCGYLAGFGYEVRHPVVPAQNAALVPLLKGLHLTSGLSGYWAADDITLDTGGQIVIRSLNRVGGKVIPSKKLDEPAWYDPQQAYADFVVLYKGSPGTPPFTGFTGITPFNDAKSVLATFGTPARTYHDGQYTIMVWNKNLLADMRSS
jgi:hypothetical protein